MSSESSPDAHLDTFDIFGLPTELRCKVWEEAVLNDDIFGLDKILGPNMPSHAVRRCIPGYFRPCVLLMDPNEALSSTYYRTMLFNRLPPLFLVSKQVANEAREVAFRHVLVELDKDICRPLLRRFAKNKNRPMLRNMRNLYVSTKAEIPKPQSFQKPSAFGTGWPRLFFAYRQVPLFKIEINTEGTRLTLYAQRCLKHCDEVGLIKAVTLWSGGLDANHRFSNLDLFAVATIIQKVQSENLFKPWILRLDQQDVATQAKEAAKMTAEEMNSGSCCWDTAWLRLEPEFRATIIELSAPCLRRGWWQ